MAATIFSKQLQKLRKERGIKQEQLAEYLGVSTQAVSKWENGSYPDGDLLPKIATYFEVSIDYLYGNEQSTKSLAEQVEHFLREKIEEQGNGSDIAVEEMKNFQWAMQRASFGQTAFQKYESTPEEQVTGSGVVCREGVSIMRLSEDLEYYYMIQRPKDGFEAYFSNTEELAKLFRFLGDENRLKVLFFMMSLDADECVHAETVAKSLGISLETAQEALQQAENISDHGYLIDSKKLIMENGRTQELYQCYAAHMPPVLMVLAAAKDILKSISMWYGLHARVSEPWFNRDKLLEIFRGEKRNELIKKQE